MVHRNIARLAPAALLIFMACATLRVQVQYDQQAPFDTYKTFKLVQPRRKSSQKAPRQIRNPLFTKDVMRQIAPVMESKGFTEVADNNSADLMVVFYAQVKNRADWVPPTYHVGRWGRAHRISPGHSVRYKEGTLVIDIVDSKSKELVWRGTGTDVLNRSAPAKDLVAAVEKILEEFPPLAEAE